MKKFTKILSLLLCLAMVFSFAACAGKTDDSATTTEETVPADTTPINITALTAHQRQKRTVQYLDSHRSDRNSAPYNQGRS